MSTLLLNIAEREYAARLDQFSPPLDGKTAQQILQQILSTPEQTYVDFFVMPPGGLATLTPPMKDPFVCPSGVNVHTHLEGVSKLPFAFAWTAPVQEINSPTTFQTSMPMRSAHGLSRKRWTMPVSN